MTEPFTRHPEAMGRADTALIVVDVQDKLISLIAEHKAIVWNIRRLLDGAGILGLPALATEQYPQGLGGTVEELRERLPKIWPKLTFSCAGNAEFCGELASLNVHKCLVAGIETHVCVQQTVLDLLAEGFRVYLAVDATGTRHSIDRDVALRRIESAGATLTTTEAALFEWCQAAGTPEFKRISQLIREPQPV